LFIKNLFERENFALFSKKNKKFEKNPQKTHFYWVFLVGFLGGFFRVFFWVGFLCGFFNANPASSCRR
jgi:hypothetical protein